MNFRLLITTMGIFSFLFSGCGKKPPPNEQVEQPVLKVAVFVDGRLTVDGNNATVETLRDVLHGLSKRKGVVWYYREAGQQEPPPVAMEVMKAVVEARLPIRFSTRPDYSDSVGPDGRPIEQKQRD